MSAEEHEGLEFQYGDYPASPASAMAMARGHAEPPPGWVVTFHPTRWTFGPDLIGFDFTKPFRLRDIDGEREVGVWSFSQERHDGDEEVTENTRVQYFVRRDGSARIQETVDGETTSTVLGAGCWALETAWTSFGSRSGVRVVQL